MPPVKVLLPLEPMPQAATTNPAATITAIAGYNYVASPSLYLLRLVEANGDTLRPPAPCVWRQGTVTVLSSVCRVAELTCTNRAAGI